MAARRDSDDLTCPRCGATLTNIDEAVMVEARVEDDQLRVDVECPECDAPLEFVIDGTPADAVGGDVWIDDRRDDRAGK